MLVLTAAPAAGAADLPGAAPSGHRPVPHKARGARVTPPPRQPGPARHPDASEESVVVTGSRIANAGFRSPTPLTVISARDIANQSPSNNLADLVNTYPALAGSTRPENSRLALSSGLAGINALNLRALGEIRTLVLVDGKRQVPSSVTGLIDINTIPQQLVRRVDIVTGGASAAYGSDAVAGVVNFILDKKYTGLKVSADSGISTYGDGVNYSFAAAGGFGFAHDRGHVLLSGEYADQDGIFHVSRGWNFGRGRVIANPAYTTTNGLPFYIIASPGGTNNMLPGGIINASTGGTPNALRGLYFGPGGSVNRYNYGLLSTPTTSIGGDWALADNGRNIGLTPDDDRRNVFARVSYDVTSWATLFGEASYNWNQTLFNAGPQALSAQVLQASNPYLVNALGPAALAGVKTVTLGTTAVDLPYRKSNNQRDVQRYMGGGEGVFALFGHDAVWSAYAQYGKTHTHEQLRDILNNANLTAATDAVRAPSGAIVCRSTLTNPTNGCSPIDFLGTGVISQAAADYVLGDPYRDQTLEQTNAGINLSTTPFSTWAGAVSIAAGGEYRDEKVSGSVPQLYQSGWSVEIGRAHV